MFFWAFFVNLIISSHVKFVFIEGGSVMLYIQLKVNQLLPGNLMHL